MVECLEEQGDIVVEQVVAFPVATSEHVAARARGRVAASDKNRHVEDLNEDVHNGDLFVFPDGLVEGFNE